MKNTMIVIDGNSLIHRAFYALPPMKKRSGQQTNALYGFFTMLFNIVDQYQPGYLAVAFDRKEKTFRHDLFVEYKAGRKKTPEELIGQIPMLKEALDQLGIARLESEGYEADDILGALSKQAAAKGIRACLLTGDRDAFQLISSQVCVLMTKKGVSDLEIFDEPHLREVYGLSPAQIVDLKSLMGDKSDNIPGVPGVGEKTALKLLSQYGTLEGVYEHLDQLPAGKLRERLEQNKELAVLSKSLATIHTDVPLEGDIQTFLFDGFDDVKLAAVLEELEFKSLLKRWSLEEKEVPQAETISLETVHALEDALGRLEKPAELAIYFDGETIGFAADDATEYSISLNISLFEGGISVDTALAKLRPLFTDGSVQKVIHDAKGLMHFLAKSNILIAGLSFDIMVAEYVINPTRRIFTLEKLREYYGVGGRAAAIFSIKNQQEKRIEKMGLGEIFYEIEMPLISVLFDMEQDGFAVHIPTLQLLSERYIRDIERCSADIYELAGTSDFNIASTKHLGVILFERLGLPAVKRTKTGYSTDIEVLEKLQGRHPIIDRIIEYRQLTKLKNTYIDGLLHAADPITHKIYTTFNQVSTATGRISSVEPNLQNIPIRSAFSAEIRSAFVPSRPENYIVSADYSQIELRILAHISQDPHMCDAFAKEEDIHTRTAAEVFDVPPEDVTPEMRGSAKAVNFGIVYGISDFGLARNLGIPRYKAAEYIAKYLEEFSGVRDYMKSIVEQAKQDGYVKTLFGRIRYIDELSSSNFNTRSFGERAALNTPIQGTAADIIKLAMIQVFRQLQAEGLRSRLILQVHDELIVDAHPDEVERVKAILTDAMQNVCALSVALKANVAVGKTWAEAK